MIVKEFEIYVLQKISDFVLEIQVYSNMCQNDLQVPAVVLVTFNILSVDRTV